MDTILIIVDALRRPDVGCYGRDDGITPNIDRIAADGIVFENCFAQSNYTDLCLSSILSGKTPLGHGVHRHGASYTEENLEGIAETGTEFLPQTLSAEGIKTVGLDWMGRWHRWGYDEYGVGESNSSVSLRDRVVGSAASAVKTLPEPAVRRIKNLSYRISGIPDPRADCEQLTDQAIKYSTDIDDDLFMFVHYWDVHPPFLPPEKFEERFSYDDKTTPLSEYFRPEAKGRRGGEYAAYATGKRKTLGESKAAYDGTIAWVDEQIGRLYDHLRESGTLDETLLIVTADHGHFFGEHDIFSDNCSLYDESIHVPLVMHHPEFEHERVEGLVQHTDIRPTVHDAYDLPVPGDIRGNVLPDETREYVFAETVERRAQAIRTTHWKLIRPLDIEFLESQYWYDQGGELELYDLNADPNETENIAFDRPDVVERLVETLDREIAEQQSVERSGESTNEGPVDESEIEAVRSNLQSLGYLDSR